MKHVVVIGGGTGVFVALTGLKKLPLELSAIVTMADDGGSSGILREEFGVLPPGDIRRALVALSSSSSLLSRLFSYRFSKGKGLKKHSFGNLFLAVLEEISGDFQKGVEEAAKILHAKGRVIPVTLTNTRLMARLENGRLIKGETNIDIPRHDGRLKIEEVFLRPPAKANPLAKKVIEEADAIVIGPGDLYTSIIPNFLVRGIKEAVRKSKAKKIYVANIMTKYGETNGFSASQFLSVLEKYLGKNIIDYFLVNISKPQEKYLRYYKKEKAEPVKYDRKKLRSLRKPKVIFARLLRRGKFLRHDPDKLARLIFRIVKGEYE